ncbi:MAG: phosphoribosyl-AMP cyclohydrolase [Sulfitobacter sp.]
MTEAGSNYNTAWLDDVSFDAAGLVCAIAQDLNTKRILMVAWMNRDALLETVATGRVVYFSRSRQKLWRKGEESGNTQRLREIRLDCDGDVVLLDIEQTGGIACHTGRESCFYRRLDDGHWTETDAPLKSPEELYGSAK